MIREIMHDTWFLSQKSEKATKEDAQIAQDLLRRLKWNTRISISKNSGENSRAGPRRSSSTSVIIWRES